MRQGSPPCLHALQNRSPRSSWSVVCALAPGVRIKPSSQNLDGGTHGGHGQGHTGRGAAARIHLGVAVLDGCSIGTQQGHGQLVGPALLAATAVVLHSLGLHGVPGSSTADEAAPLSTM